VGKLVILLVVTYTSPVQFQIIVAQVLNTRVGTEKDARGTGNNECDPQ
jgi:hypothetical protein